MRSVRRRPHFISLITFCLMWASLVMLLTTIFVSPLSAAPVTYETVRVGPGQYAPNGVTSPVTFNVKTPGVSKFHQIVPVATPSTLGKLARKTLRGGGVGLAVGAAIEGLGYLIDKATGDINKLEQVEVSTPSDGGIQGTQLTAGNNYTGTIPASALSWYNQAQYKFTITQNGEFKWWAWDCPASHPAAIQQIGHQVRCYQSVSTETQENIIDLSPEDYQRIDNQLNTALSLAEKTAIIRNALSKANPSGTVNTDNYPVTIVGNSSAQELYSDWPEFKTLLQQLVNAQIASYLATVQPDFEVAPEDQVIVDNSTDFMPPDFTLPTLELPPFCEWASWLCEPFVGGDQPDVPMLDLEAPNYDSGLPSGGTCPQPYAFSTGFTGPIEISFQPACDLATAIRTPLIAISYLMAGFIVVGVRR